MKHSASVVIMLDTRKPLKGGTFSVKLRVTWNREQRYYPTGKHMSQADYDKVMGERPRNEAKETRMFLDSYYAKAKSVADNLPNFSFEAFDKAMGSNQRVKSSVFDTFEEYIERLNGESRISTALSYGNAMKAIRAFTKKPLLEFATITPDWLARFERWITEIEERDKSGKVIKRRGTSTTAGIYLRSLRTIYNQAIANKAIPSESYPFGRNQYIIPSGRNVKKAVPKADIRKLFEYQSASDTESYHKDLWVFSYLCNGANMKDIARLRYANLDGDRVVFVRSKTARSTKQDLKPIVASLAPAAKAIIEKWGQKPALPQTYVFPILDADCTPQRERSQVQGIVKQVNKYIRRIGKAVGIEQHLTTYNARHSFATVLKLSNAPISFISEALGHKDLKTTENYLSSFDDATRDQYAAALTDF
jgi:integrase/recombinase XerD